MSFREKSLWLMFGSLIGVFGLYFTTIWPVQGVNVMPWQIGLFAVMVGLLVVVQIVGSILLGILSRDRRQEPDERDRLIGLQSMRNGSYVLAVGVCASLTMAVFSSGNFWFTHLLLGFWVVSQLVEIGSQLYLYRRQA